MEGDCDKEFTGGVTDTAGCPFTTYVFEKSSTRKVPLSESRMISASSSKWIYVFPAVRLVYISWPSLSLKLWQAEVLKPFLGIWLSHKCESSWCLSDVASVVTGSVGAPWYLNVVVNRWQVSVVSKWREGPGFCTWAFVYLLHIKIKWKVRKLQKSEGEEGRGG